MDKRDYNPNEIHRALLADNSKYKLLIAGHDFGKTALLAQWISKFDAPGVRSIWFAIGKEQHNATYVQEFSSKFFGVKRKTEYGNLRILLWPNGMETWLLNRKTRHFDNYGLNRTEILAVALDDAGHYSEGFFRTMLPHINYDANIFIASCVTKNNSFREFVFELAPKLDYKTYTYTSFDANPYNLSDEEFKHRIEEWKLVMPPDMYRREVLSQWD